MVLISLEILIIVAHNTRVKFLLQPSDKKNCQLKLISRLLSTFYLTTLVVLLPDPKPSSFYVKLSLLAYPKQG